MMPIRVVAAGFFSLVLLITTVAMGDIVHLKDGSSVQGTLKRTEDGWLVQSDGKSVHVLNSQVDSIELTHSAPATPRAAMERLNSLRHSVEGLSNLTDIIARFQRFVDQSTDPATTIEAKKDLAIWQDRQKQKMVKVGSDWVTAEGRVKLIEQAGQSAETARQLMKQGRTKEADPLLAEAVAVDPTNATALYLTGLLRYQQEQIVAARKAFEAAAAIVPNHAPSLNNLAVTQWRQKQYVPALSNFDEAMLAAPVDKLILDNVAVALQTLPPELVKNAIAQKVIRHFNEQDQQLAENMARQGMHRLGSLWVSDQDIARWKRDEKDIQDKLDQLAGDFDRSRQRIDQLAQTIADNDGQIHRIEATSVVTDPRTGGQVPTQYPQAYYDLQKANQAAQRERDAEVGKLDQMKKQATDLQNNRPSVKNLAVMRMVGADGSPLRISLPAPATLPVK
jgi:Flp pilus assembly protein TadD